jgi:putative transposase
VAVLVHVSWWQSGVLGVYDPEPGQGNSLWCPAHVPHTDEQLVRKGDIRDSELVCRDDDWYVHLVVKRSVTVQDEYDDVLALDMGARWVATCAFLSDRKTTVYGEEVRRIREHCKQLRKSIRKSKLRQGQQVVEPIGDAEARKVDDRLHKIARSIVEDADERNAVIVGDLGGIRKANDTGR